MIKNKKHLGGADNFESASQGRKMGMTMILINHPLLPTNREVHQKNANSQQRLL